MHAVWQKVCDEPENITKTSVRACTQFELHQTLADCADLVLNSKNLMLYILALVTSISSISSRQTKTVSTFS